MTSFSPAFADPGYGYEAGYQEGFQDGFGDGQDQGQDYGDQGQDFGDQGQDFAGQGDRASDYLKERLLIKPEDDQLASALERRSTNGQGVELVARLLDRGQLS